MEVCKPLWLPPPTGALKLNFESSAIGHLGVAKIRGIIRDCSASHVISFLVR